MKKLALLLILFVIKTGHSQVTPISYSQFLCPSEVYKNQMICLNERIPEENSIAPYPNLANCYYSSTLPSYDNNHNYLGNGQCAGVCCGGGNSPDASINTRSFYNLELKCINLPLKVSITKIDNFCWSIKYLDTGIFLFNINVKTRYGREIENYYCTDTTWDYSCGQNRTWKQLTTIISSSSSCNNYSDTTCNLIKNGGFENYTTYPSYNNSYQQNINQLLDWSIAQSSYVIYANHLSGNFIGKNTQNINTMSIGNIPPQPFPSGGGFIRNWNSSIGQFVDLCPNQKYSFSTYSMRGSIASQDITLSGVNTSSFPTNNTLTTLTTIPANDINLYYNWHKFQNTFTTTTSFNGIVIEGMGYYDDINITPLDTVIFNTQLIGNRCDSAEMILNIPGCYGPYNLDVVVNNDTIHYSQVQDGHTVKIPLAKNNIVNVLSITNLLGCATILNTSDTLIVNNSGDASFTSTDFCEGQTNIITFLGDTGIFSLVNNNTSATINPNTGIINGAQGGDVFIISHAVCLDTVYDTIQCFKNSALFTSSDICVGNVNTINITGTTGGIFSLVPPINGATINTSTGEISGATTGNSYTIKYKVGNPCPDSLTQTIQVVAIEDPSFTANDFCVNSNNLIVITGSQNGTFSFSPTPTDGATINSTSGIINNATSGNSYSIKYITGGYCKDSSTQFVTALDIPTSSLVSNGGDLCGNDSIPITLNLTGSSPWDISYTDGTNTYIVNGITASPYTLWAKNIGNYQVTSVTDNQCNNNKDTSLVIVKGDSVNVYANLTSGCEPQEVKFWTNVNGLNGDCVWNFGDGSNDINLCDTVTHTYYSSGSYGITLQVSSSKCKDTLFIPNYVTVKANPTAVFYYTPQNPSVLNNTVNFTNSSINNIENIWYLNNNLVDTILDPSIVLPPVIGDHEVCLVVKNNFSCYDTICNDIYILDESLFYIPNAFIPNNDGLNDIFKPIISNTIKYNFKVFNRWGKLIFETNDTNEGWDGTYKGSDSEAGVYSYRMTYRFKGNYDDQLLTGHFSLLR